MSNPKDASNEEELARIGGQVVMEVVRDQMQGTVSALRKKLEQARAVSAKAAEAAAMAKYLGVPKKRRPDK